MLTRTFKHVIKRNFWTVAKGDAIGYIENVGHNGTFINNPMIYFRETSSNLSNGEVFNVSTVDLHQSEETLRKYMRDRKPVYVKYNQQLFSFPTRGNILEQYFATEIVQIGDENVTVSLNQSMPPNQSVPFAFN